MSPTYSIAEYARLEAGAPRPAFDGEVAPVGADSPEGALDAMARAASDLDLRAAITQLDPEEMAALYDYAPLFLDDAARAAAEAEVDLDLTFTDLRTEDGPGDTTRVVVGGFELRVSQQEEWSSSDLELTYDGSCVRYRQHWDYEDPWSDEWDDYWDGDLDEGEWCRGQGFEDEVTGGFGSGAGFLAGISEVELSVLTVQRDGRWYLTPTRSLLETIPTVLRQIDLEDIDDLREWLWDWFGPWEAEERFEVVGEAIEGGEGSPDPDSQDPDDDARPQNKPDDLLEESTEPESTEPESTEPESTEPESTEPDAGPGSGDGGAQGAEDPAPGQIDSDGDSIVDVEDPDPARPDPTGPGSAPAQGPESSPPGKTKPGAQQSGEG